MEALWRNPELIRHARTETRPVRMAAAAAVSVFVCALLVLIFFHPGVETDSVPRDQAAILYILLVSLQSVLLCLWCFSACSQVIASERSLKTFDFLRTTRLTSWELLVGMVFGAPLMAYFVVACSLPFTIFLGLYAGFSVVAIAVTYLMLLLVAVVLSLAGLTISMTMDQPRTGGLVLLLVMIGFAAWSTLTGLGNDSPFPGLTAMLVIFGLSPLYGVAPGAYGPILDRVPFFGAEVPALLVSIVLYASAGAWLVLILVHNLKKDREDIRFLSRWRAVGFSAYVNVMALALLRLQKPVVIPGVGGASIVAAAYLFLNFFMLYGVGLASLTPAERLKSWSRRAASSAQFYWSEDGPPWPWMVVSAIAAFLGFVLEVVITRHFIPLSEWPVAGCAGFLFVLLVFAVRDVLFLEWCVVKGFRSPVVKGILFLFLYYVSTFIFAVLFLRPSLAWFSPFGVFGYPETDSMLSVVIGIVLQIAASIFLLVSIRRRLAPPGATSAVASAATSS